MKYARILTAAVLAVLSAGLTTGCGEKPAAVTISYSRPAEIEVPATLRKLGIASFTGQTKQEQQLGEIAADRLSADLDAYNRKFNRYQLVDRRNLKQILDEQDLQLAISDSGSAAKAGQIAKVDAMIYGSVRITKSEVPKERTTIDPLSRSTKRVSYVHRTVTAVVSFSLANIQTGETIIARTFSPQYDSEKDNPASSGGANAVMKGLGMNKDESVGTEEAARRLVEQAAEQFVATISPHDEQAVEALAKGKSDLVKRGNTLAVAGEFTDALAMYEDAMKAKPDDAGAAFNAGVVYEKTGNLAKAEECYSRAIRLEPNSGAYIQARARVRRMSGATTNLPAGSSGEQARTESPVTNP